jgi:hypothetical protein
MGRRISKPTQDEMDDFYFSGTPTPRTPEQIEQDDMAEFYFAGPTPRTEEQMVAEGDLEPAEQLEQVTAEPATAADTEPKYDIPEPVDTQPAPALETELAPAKPSVEPGKTEAVKAAETDEYEPLFGEYDKARKTYGEESEALGRETEEVGRKNIMMTGIAGALQSFGEGLAAITGGSAKPLQTAAATVRSIGEQKAAAQERKAKTLKERMLMAREPLEAKAQEIKFRDVFEQRQKTKRLEDPASDESKQARQLANNFLDAYTASVSNRVNPEQLAKIEAIKPRLENLNANQIKDFMDNLNKLKFTESRVDIEEAKGERTTKQQEAKTAASQEFKVQQDAQKAIVKVESELEQDQKFYDQYKQFRSNLQKAIAGDPDAQRFIKNNMDAFSYMKARTLESKGVFTDQDAERLTTLLKDRTWFEKFQAWLAGGLQGQIPMDVLQSLDAALKDEPKNPVMIKNQKLSRLANIARKSTNPALQNSASYYESILEQEPEAQPAQPVEAAPEKKSFKNVNEAIEAKKNGLIKSGESIIINGKSVKVK